MPVLSIETNVPQDKIPADFPSKLCGVISKTLGPDKPVSICCASVTGGVKMSWGGTDEPAAQALLKSVGALGVEENKKHAKAIYDAVCPVLGVPADRMYIVFADYPTSAVGFNGSTFQEFFG